MGTYTTQVKRCPHCGKIYERRRVRTPYPDEALVKFERIFAECPHCQKTFRDSDAYELAVMDPPACYLKKFHTSNILLAGGFAILGLFSLSVATEPVGAMLVMFALGGMLLFSDYVRYKRNIARIESERYASEKRLERDPHYALLLKAAGFDVPEKYLPKIQKK